jgi:DNA polymerase III delta subunit
MLKLFSGNDYEARKKAIAAMIKGSQEDGSYRRHAGDLTVPMLDPYFSESLFGETYVVVLDGLSLFPEETRTYLLSQIGAMLDSNHSFIVIDEKFTKEWKDEAKKQKTEITDFSAEERYAGASVFGFTDLYLSRDKKGAWIAFTKLIREGSAPEEVHGALFWAVKSLFLVVSGTLGRSAEELGMKPFPYQKMKGFAQKWTKEEARDALRSMTGLLESTRKSGGDLGISLERFILV